DAMDNKIIPTVISILPIMYAACFIQSATQKLRTLSSKGEFAGELGELKVSVEVDTEKRLLKIRDCGIGMTADEVDRYINQIAFSGAEEFMAKYQDQAIIGHFGLGFYSSFMVSDKVEIYTQSYRDEAKSVHWSCTGTPEFEMEELDEKLARGTEIVLHLSEDMKEYAESSAIEGLLKKYCRFLPVPIVFGKVKEWKDGKYQDTEKDNVINNIEPLWTRMPSEITEEQYKEFYSELYPMSEEPLFSIHLNIDYPFNLTGILYFPKIRNNFEIQKNKIQLYCNQVYVTDQVEGIVPEYLTLLHGVIDSPDIPLNVSRSYLQSDPNVKKISSYITRKVADRLQELFKTMRSDYEQKWDDLKVFIQYGILTDEKFADKAQDFMLWKNIEGKYFTAKEYTEKVKEQQTDKNKDLILLYVDDVNEKHAFVEAAKTKGYDVLEMNGQLDNHYINWYEQKNEKTRFVRVDSDVIEKLIQKEEQLTMTLTTAQQELLTPVFESQMPEDEKINYHISFEAMAADEAPVVITQNEFMRRMKEMAQMGGGMSQFYGQMPDNFTIAVNGNHPIVIDILGKVESEYGDKLKSTT
ncbi:MAG: molecular chaperone HtpG, partial [Alistipes sp.]|nr:molecular chaperone HtpG [Alistipes sp.]